MKIDETKMMLAAAEAEAVQKVHATAVGELLDPQKPHAHVRGIAVGVKWTNGEPTGQPALLVLVTHKLAKEQLTKGEMLPSTIEFVPTDVLAIGEPVAGDGEPLKAGIQTLAERVRPAKGGYSVGHKDITAGTIATCVYNILPGGSTNPPFHGVGIPPKFYVLSNNHVLANVNDGKLGDAILQPGPVDGGVDPADRIATLSRFIPIKFAAGANNLVDAAIGEGQFHDLDREIYWSGAVRGWRPKTGVAVGMTVKKTGRTSNLTTGRIIAIQATVNVNYGQGRVARFIDQIVTSNMSAGGDSGSLVTTLDNIAVGLLFAGSPVMMIANQIENVRALLRVEVAEQIL
jgi:hypothetical protein